ncbi:hypothetical protein ACH5RR_022349 [Cinchona calisaya]|uniref:PB1 domain-containing protein n=1 Tax=Cinchona calisaya TaxID=153742 RepID=A0ABD2ZBG7_9GENT
MENYSYPSSYPDSGDSSPRSREIDFENPPPWEDPQNPQQQQQPLYYKVKVMCSYGGKIHPRPHDNQLSYIGGETKILAVDRNIKFAPLVGKLSALWESDSVSFKYQLPGEDLDALISVTNDDDLEHMMNEYDRLFRASPKPARLRLFLFPANHPPPSQSPTVVGSRSFGSDDQPVVIKSEKERFVEALNSGPIQIQSAPPPTAVAPPPPQAGNVDFLFGLEKGMVQPPVQQQQQQHMQPPPPPVVAPWKFRDPIAEQNMHENEIQVPGLDERLIGSDPIQKHIQDLQRLRLEEQQGLYRRKSDDNLAGGYPTGGGGEYYVQKVPEKVAPVTVPGTMGIPTAGYWPEKQVAGGVFPASTFGTDQPVYVIQAPAGAYHHPQMMRPVTAPTGQGYYTVQRLPEMYREQQQQQQQQQPPYNVGPQMGAPVQSVAAAPSTLTPQGPTKMSAAYSEGYGMARPVTTTGGVGVTMTETGYAQMAYDSGVGRQVYYTAQQGAVNVMGTPPPSPAQYQAAAAMAAAAAAVSGDVKALNQEAGKVVPKATQASSV